MRVVLACGLWCRNYKKYWTCSKYKNTLQKESYMRRLTRKKKNKEKLSTVIIKVFVLVLLTIIIAIIVGYILAKVI